MINYRRIKNSPRHSGKNRIFHVSPEFRDRFIMSPHPLKTTRNKQHTTLGPNHIDRAEGQQNRTDKQPIAVHVNIPSHPSQKTGTTRKHRSHIDDPYWSESNTQGVGQMNVNNRSTKKPSDVYLQP